MRIRRHIELLEKRIQELCPHKKTYEVKWVTGRGSVDGLMYHEHTHTETYCSLCRKKLGYKKVLGRVME